MVGAGPEPAPAARARTSPVAGPVAGLIRDLASGIIDDLSASLLAGIARAGGCFLKLYLGRCGSISKPLVTTLHKTASDFFQCPNFKKMGDVGYRSMHQGTSHRLLFSNRARFRRERANLIPFIWVLVRVH